MKIKTAQIRLKTADFDFNLNNIISNVDENADLMIFPRFDAEDTGCRALVLDKDFQNAQIKFYENIANKNFSCAILIGDILIKDGQTEVSTDGFYEIDNKKIFVSDTFVEDVECDLYILSKNRYYAKNTFEDFVDSIETKSDFIYINSVGISDCNIYSGMSFGKNKNNELTFIAPLCREYVEFIDFSNRIEYFESIYEKQIVDVTTFALKEYLENTGFSKVILGLSGGIDSALTAALACKAIGAENVLGVMMPSMYSSEGSITDSIALANNLGMSVIKEPIKPLFDEFMKEREHLGDLSEENLQARLRGLILMFYSNRENRLLLSTGNKSESAMGFGTLYGDLAGGYNMIADLTKTEVYKVSNYLNKNDEIIPQSIIDKAPSAELHPNQKDSDRLPDYAILDDIIEMYLNEHKSVDEISEKYDKNIVKEVVRKIYRMQFKRYQGCLGIRLSEHSFLSGIDLPVVQRFY